MGVVDPMGGSHGPTKPPTKNRKTPMAMTILHPARNTMLIVIRGTLARQEWAYDFQVKVFEYGRSFLPTVHVKCVGGGRPIHQLYVHWS